ncbi:MAG: hypothetical protein AB7U73_04880 [Pirellulales bacterium]
MFALADYLPESADGGAFLMLDRQTILVLVGLFALIVMVIGFAVRPFGRGSRYRRAPYGRQPGQVPIVGRRTAMEIQAAEERDAKRTAKLKRAVGPKHAGDARAGDARAGDAAAGDTPAADEQRREQA